MKINGTTGSYIGFQCYLSTALSFKLQMPSLCWVYFIIISDGAAESHSASSCLCLSMLLFAKRHRGIFKLHVGCANTQWTSGIFSPVPQGPGKDEWHTTTKSKMTAGAGNQTRISRSQASTLNHWTIPGS